MRRYGQHSCVVAAADRPRQGHRPRRPLRPRRARRSRRRRSPRPRRSPSSSPWRSSTPSSTTRSSASTWATCGRSRSALSAKDYYTLGHAGRVAAYTAMLGRELGWPDERLDELAERRLPARHRQDRRLRPRAAQGRPADLGRVGAHAPAPRHQRRDRAPPVRRGARRRSAPPSRTLRRQAVSRRPERRGDPAGGSPHVRGRLLRRHVLRTPLPPRADLSPVSRRAASLRRHPVRSRHGRRVPQGAGAPASPAQSRRHPGRAGIGTDRSRRARPAALARRRGAPPVPGDGRRAARASASPTRRSASSRPS